jgi:outer membrane protein assembly factor BamA
MEDGVLGLKLLTRAMLAGAALVTAPAAWADPSWTLNKVIITGNKTLTTEQLMAVVQEKPGHKITVAEITADRDAITKALEDAHSSATSINPSMQAVGQKVNIIFAVIDDKGAQAPVVTKVAPKLHEEIFDGNKSVPTEQLVAASGLTPGQDLSNEKVLAAENAINATYKAAKLPPGLGVNITGETKRLDNGTYDVIWHITETKAKKKRNTEDDGYKSE